MKEETLNVYPNPTSGELNLDLSDYLSNSPVNPNYGTWAIILAVGQEKLNLNLDIDILIKKYKNKFYTKA